MNNKKTVFLSGPMRGVPRAVSLGWRQKATELLSSQFHVLHAMRGREEKETMPDPRGAVIRDKQDVQLSEIILVDDTLPDVSMVGTAMEILYAYERDKPVIVFGDAHKGNYWYDYHTHIRVGTLEEACELISKLFV